MSTRLSALPVLLVVLTITTGLIDAVSVLGLGRVFTANMTGNIVFLGFAIAGVPGFSASRSLAALAAFLAGAIVGGRLGLRLEASRRRWLFVVALVESTLLFVAALLASGYDGETLASVAAMLGGAIVGGLLVLRGGLGLPLVLTGAITLVGTAVYVAYPVASEAS